MRKQSLGAAGAGYGALNMKPYTGNIVGKLTLNKLDKFARKGESTKMQLK